MTAQQFSGGLSTSALLELATREDARSQEEKRRLLDHAEHATERVRLVADLCVGAYTDRDDALLPAESQWWNLAAARRCVKELFGVDPSE